MPRACSMIPRLYRHAENPFRLEKRPVTFVILDIPNPYITPQITLRQRQLGTQHDRRRTPGDTSSTTKSF